MALFWRERITTCFVSAPRVECLNQHLTFRMAQQTENGTNRQLASNRCMCSLLPHYILATLICSSLLETGLPNRRYLRYLDAHAYRHSKRKNGLLVAMIFCIESWHWSCWENRPGSCAGTCIAVDGTYVSSVGGQTRASCRYIETTSLLDVNFLLVDYID